MIRNSLKPVVEWGWTKPKRNVAVMLFVRYIILISNRFKVAFSVFNI